MSWKLVVTFLMILQMITGAPPTSKKISSIKNGQDILQDPVNDGVPDNLGFRSHPIRILMVLMFLALASLAIVCFWKLYWIIKEDYEELD